MTSLQTRESSDCAHSSLRAGNRQNQELGAKAGSGWIGREGSQELGI